MLTPALNTQMQTEILDTYSHRFNYPMIKKRFWIKDNIRPKWPNAATAPWCNIALSFFYAFLAVCNTLYFWYTQATLYKRKKQHFPHHPAWSRCCSYMSNHFRHWFNLVSRMVAPVVYTVMYDRGIFPLSYMSCLWMQPPVFLGNLPQVVT